MSSFHIKNNFMEEKDMKTQSYDYQSTKNQKGRQDRMMNYQKKFDRMCAKRTTGKVSTRGNK